MIISDTHDFEFGDAEVCEAPFRLPAPKVDVLLHCGDLTMQGGPKNYQGVLEMLGNIQAELKIVIAGNHDLDLDAEYWASHPRVSKYKPDQSSEAKGIMTGPEAAAAGVTYVEEGLHKFTLKNGAKFTIYTSPYQPEFYDWAFPYERDEDRFNPPSHVAPGVKSIAKNIIPDFPAVDIVMTHGPPMGILDWTKYNKRVGCEALMRAVSRAKPRLYCFGHIHEAYGATIVTWKDDTTKIGAEAVKEESKQMNVYPDSAAWLTSFGKDTIMVNAAIKNLSYEPVNAP
jgi:hypothetical protein